MLIEEQEVRILIDPGNYSTGQKDVRGIDVILITHEHFDHIDMESLKIVLRNSPNAKIFTNNGVARKLSENNIEFEILDDGKKINVKDVSIEAIGKRHAMIHESIPVIENTGYLISERLFYPGDAFTVPNKEIEILALPVAAP
jgi:L-ascorbate metabolism protein UlaG (beta-lactamase superfamily)